MSMLMSMLLLMLLLSVSLGVSGHAGRALLVPPSPDGFDAGLTEPLCVSLRAGAAGAAINAQLD